MPSRRSCLFSRSLRPIAALVLCLAAGRLAAQGLPAATLTGRVSTAGTPLPGVLVTVKAPTLQGMRSSVTSANGDYVFNNLPPGEYTITFSLTSFQTRTDTLPLRAAEKKSLDTEMSVSAVSTTTEVVARSETVSTSNGRASPANWLAVETSVPSRNERPSTALNAARW